MKQQFEIRNNTHLQSTAIRQLFILIFGAIVLTRCASHTATYLTPESRSVRQQFWKSNSHLEGYFMEGTAYQTPIFKFDSQQPGPAILILGGTHGNEPAGFEAAYRLLKILSTNQIKTGKIFIVPEANRMSVANNNRRIPVPEGIDFERGNLNRCYPGDPEGLPMEQEAHQITQFIRREKIDLFIDLHESPKFHLESKDAKGNYYGLGQTLIYVPNEEATWLAMIVADALNARIAEKMKQFTLVEHPIESSAAWSAGKQFDIPAFTVETCKQLPLEERVSYQLEILKLIFREKGMLD